VEVAHRLDPAVGQHHRVVDGRRQLAVRTRLGEGQRVAGRAVDLGRAAQRVRVLDPGVVGAVGGDDGGSGQQGGDVGGRALLAGMGAQADQVGRERAVRPEQALHAHGRGHVGRPQQAGQVGAGQDQHAEHAVGAVDQSQPLLRLQGHVERQGHVGQGREVPAAAERSELGHLGQLAVVEQAQQGGGQLGPCPRHPSGQGAGPQQDHRPRDLGLHRIAEAGGVRGDQRPLEPGTVLGRDPAGGQAPEPGGDAVDGLARRGHRLDPGPGGGHGRHGLVRQLDPGPAAGDGHHVVPGETLGAQHDRHGPRP
jgi:hypothetical protein